MFNKLKSPSQRQARGFPTCKMNSPDVRATDSKPNPPPPPPPPPPLPPSPLTGLKSTANNEEDHHLHSSIDLNSESESENTKDKEKDEESSSCSSLYSTSDSESDFFQINPPELSYPPPSPTTTDVNLNTDGIEKIHNPNGEKNAGLRIERRPPVAQSMARDPNRIPSSIFSRGPITPMEWSMASNESLFSIHMGNTSFSKDQVFLTGRSGELRGFVSGMTTEYPSAWISPDLRSAAAAGGVGRREMGDVVVEMDEEAAASANAEAMREVMRAAAEGRESEKKLMLGRSISRRSDGSTTSFAFPILTGDGRVGSIKVNFEHHRDPQLNPQIKPSKIFSNKARTATMRTRHQDPSQASASAQTNWFSYFCCKFRCC